MKNMFRAAVFLLILTGTASELAAQATCISSSTELITQVRAVRDMLDNNKGMPAPVKAQVLSDSIVDKKVCLNDAAAQQRVLKWQADLEPKIADLSTTPPQLYGELSRIDEAAGEKPCTKGKDECAEKPPAPTQVVVVTPPSKPPVVTLGPCIPAHPIAGFPESFSGPQIWGRDGDEWWVSPTAEGIGCQVVAVYFEEDRGRTVPLTLRDDRWYISDAALRGMRPGSWAYRTSGGHRYSAWARSSNMLFWIPQELHQYIKMQPNMETYVDIRAPGGDQKLLEEFGAHEAFVDAENICPFNVGAWLIDPSRSE